MCDNAEHGGVPHVIVGSVAFHTKVNTLTPSSLFSFLHPPSDIPFVNRHNGSGTMSKKPQSAFATKSMFDVLSTDDVDVEESEEEVEET
jgi:hypothetical protein